MVSANRSMSALPLVINNAILTDRLILLLSRPSLEQCSSSTAPLRARTVGAPNVPVVGMFGGNAERDAFAAAPNHQFRVRPLHGLWIEGSVGELVVAAIEIA